MTPDESARQRCYAYAAMCKRLRAEYGTEYKYLLAGCRQTRNPTQAATKKLAGRYPQRAAELYREEVLTRGLPEPRPKRGRLPGGGAR